MHKYVIERELPGAGKLTADQLRAVAQKSNSIISTLGTKIQWVHTYVVDDKLYCVYIAEDEAALHEHADCGGFPLDVANQVATIIDPTTGE